MSQAIVFDDAQSRRIVQIYSTPDVVKQRQIVLSALNLHAGERILDIGSGPGLLVEEMAAVVGPRGSICGVDTSAAMLAISQKRTAHLPQVDLRQGDATALPYAGNEFDVAVSTQVYEYVVAMDKCLQELYRVLKPGGRALILCTDWDTLIFNTDDRERMRRILTTFEAHCADPRLPRTLAPKLRRAGLHLTRCEVYTVLNLDYDPNTYSHGLIDLITSYASGKDGITADETKAWADELRAKGQEGRYFFSINRYIFMVSKPEARVAQ